MGLIADALADKDPAAAALLLGQAFALAEYANDTLHTEMYDNSTARLGVACALIEIAERVDPVRVEEFVWRAIALRPPRSGATSDFYASGSATELASSLSFYDRRLARFVLGPVDGDNQPNWSQASAEYMLANQVQALALVEPRRAADLAETVPPDRKLARPQWDPRRRVIEVLCTRPEDRWRKYFCSDARSPRAE